jgi:hypothetical protein
MPQKRSVRETDPRLLAAHALAESARENVDGIALQACSAKMRPSRAEFSPTLCRFARATHRPHDFTPRKWQKPDVLSARLTRRFRTLRTGLAKSKPEFPAIPDASDGCFAVHTGIRDPIPDASDASFFLTVIFRKERKRNRRRKNISRHVQRLEKTRPKRPECVPSRQAWDTLSLSHLGKGEGTVERRHRTNLTKNHCRGCFL